MTIEMDVHPNEVGIISIKPAFRISGVQAEDGFALVDTDGQMWLMRFHAEDRTVGVMDVVYISPEEVEAVQVPGGPLVRRVELVLCEESPQE